MEFPLCDVCLKNEDILCEGCQRKLDSGEITHTEAELSRVFYALRKRFRSIQSGGFKRAKEIDGIILVIVPKGSAGKMIGKGGAIIAELEKKMNKRVKIIAEGTLEDVVKELIGKTEFVGINKVFGQEGERYKIRVKRRGAPPLRKGEIETIIHTVTGKKADIVFE